MIEQVQKKAFLCFTLSIVAAYFSCIGYYSNFKIDITYFLSIEDLTVIFVKWVWISLFIVGFYMCMLYSLYNYLKSIKWSFFLVMENSIIKKNIFLVILIFSVITICIAYLRILLFLGFILIIIISLVAIFLLSLFVFNALKDKRKLSELSLNDWYLIVSSFGFFFLAIPLFIGFVTANLSSVDEINVKFNNGSSMNTFNSIDTVYIGKTNNFFFIYNLNTERSTAFSMNNVESFQIVKHDENE